ncbi:sugar phosphate isomerase family [Staphylococcus durrellii]|uniref:hypothetical protein n=1 Tax=Staphylococcus durrellii TaxID=2781773 RepID=UPI00189F7099|nr:hypothetical protein [Staphylococcus durrellii]MBF7017217.1 hypothetical protein [Staphylococcus durrellii]
MRASDKVLQERISAIVDNDIIAFDNHPVSYRVIDTLYSNNTKIALISYSTDIIHYAAKNTNFNIIIPTGQVNSTFHVVIGETVCDTFKKYHIKQYFMSAPYRLNRELFQTYEEVAQIQQTLFKRTESIYLMNYPEIITSYDEDQYYKVGEMS